MPSASLQARAATPSGRSRQAASPAKLASTIAVLLDLAERCEKAEGPDRVIDRAIAVTQGWHRIEPRHTRGKHGAWISPEDWIGEMGDGSPILDSLHGTTMHRDAPGYTASLDAALTLVPEGWRVSNFGEKPNGKGWFCWLMRGSDVVGAPRYVTDPGLATPALALCAAALRARASQ